MDSATDAPFRAARDLRPLIADWVHGWARCRGTAVPVPEPDGFRIDVGRHGHRVRYVLASQDTVGERARSVASPGTWLKVCGPRADTVATLSAPWLIGEPEYLMSVGLGAGDAPEPPTGYTVEIRETGPVLDVFVHAADGGTAASGRVARWGSSATVDQVVTEPAHRRRGLGRLVMGALGSAAAARGATHAVLVATEDGHGLYTALGWAVDASLTAAHVPENPVAGCSGRP
ncbi:GNAT family N-acetyltransferase [Amycolatopsis sp. CA-230715]|uniref:GNAT family N-acetyltransferase n=1 Tax=Amycolatopsis sp. CA-230715 TaxID=2745196 RepID=UPI001C02F47F|nr:GNAT family N-acetyltransferase [Amycolatopsis sp. CA-230715]QWF76753.1 hypothetical protein HUW46_00129 [Amycolatopsis sp. CA-230715]